MVKLDVIHPQTLSPTQVIERVTQGAMNFPLAFREASVQKPESVSSYLTALIGSQQERFGVDL